MILTQQKPVNSQFFFSIFLIYFFELFLKKIISLWSIYLALFLYCMGTNNPNLFIYFKLGRSIVLCVSFD